MSSINGYDQFNIAFVGIKEEFFMSPLKNYCSVSNDSVSYIFVWFLPNDVFKLISSIKVEHHNIIFSQVHQF